MPLPPATYKTFDELAEYARERAKISAKRNGHQEFAYWATIHHWANDCAAESCDPKDEFAAHQNVTNSPAYDVVSKAEAHAFAAHCRIMLLNRGESVPPLSLDWLREAAGNL